MPTTAEIKAEWNRLLTAYQKARGGQSRELAYQEFKRYRERIWTEHNIAVGDSSPK